MDMLRQQIVGPGSFFKAHKDTPRSTDMFGSLVIVFPSPHEGGALVLRHDGHKTTFDSGVVLKTAKEPSIAYVAFFSDVEHEVLPVTAGYRVTITYNLYFREVPPQTRSAETVFRTLPVTADTFLSAFQCLLADATFLPNGGTLAFSLMHKYPPLNSQEQIDLSLFASRLKGRDALVVKRCRDFSLPVSVKVLYNDEYANVDVLLRRICKFDEDFTYSRDECELWQYILKQEDVDGKVVRAEDPGDVNYHVQWITDKTALNVIESEYAEYVCGSAELGYVDGSLHLIAEVGPPGERS